MSTQKYPPSPFAPLQARGSIVEKTQSATVSRVENIALHKFLSSILFRPSVLWISECDLSPHDVLSFFQSLNAIVSNESQCEGLCTFTTTPRMKTIVNTPLGIVGFRWKWKGL
ncbi:hypothetical protein OUZ56_008711 [Daphnia magna]|uniref:Uncharacterized protein n=1 Tax=Daphnia magna TaxID=35525 RepID=A0ABR0AE77_9CRUS|nr:hypothetical protein OUZ56_008711 [Daphnia magna]